MPSDHSYSVDGTSGTAELNLYVGGELETTYSYSSGHYNLSERLEEAVLTPDEYRVNVKLISRWHLMCQIDIAPSSPFEPYEIIVEETASRFKVKLKFGDTLVIDSHYNKNTNKVKFDPRPALSLTPGQFRRFSVALTTLLEAVPFP